MYKSIFAYPVAPTAEGFSPFARIGRNRPIRDVIALGRRPQWLSFVVRGKNSKAIESLDLIKLGAP